MPVSGHRPRGPPRRLRHDRGAAPRACSRCAATCSRSPPACARPMCSSRSTTCCSSTAARFRSTDYLALLDEVPAVEARNGTMLRGAQRTGDGDCRAVAAAGRAAAGTVCSVAATRIRLRRDRHHVDRGAGRIRARRSWPASAPAAAVPGGRPRARRCRGPRRLRGDRARTWRAWPASGRAITACSIARCASASRWCRCRRSSCPLALVWRSKLREAATVADRLGRRDGVARRAVGRASGAGRAHDPPPRRDHRDRDRQRARRHARGDVGGLVRGRLRHRAGHRLRHRGLSQPGRGRSRDA